MSLSDKDASLDLVLAAPDLLNACKRALPSWIPNPDESDGHICCELTNGDVRALLAAIAKAEGKPVPDADHNSTDAHGVKQ